MPRTATGPPLRNAPRVSYEGAKVLKIYCETSSLLHNIREDKERVALERVAKKIPMLGSELLRLEAANTPRESKRDTAGGTQRTFLITESKALEVVPKEKVLRGYSHLSDQYGGWFASPLMSDVPDEALRDEVMKRGGLKQRDAEHVTLAICNECDALLTRDKKILKLGKWLEERFKLKAWLPSQLLEAIDP
jgi:predicted nucleic acid-binding protein